MLVEDFSPLHQCFQRPPKPWPLWVPGQQVLKVRICQNFIQRPMAGHLDAAHSNVTEITPSYGKVGKNKWFGLAGMEAEGG